MRTAERVPRRLLFRLFALAIILILTPFGSAAAQSTAPMVIHAVVLAVDRSAGLVILRHEALETVPAATRICRLRAGTQANGLRRGMVIEAIVETAHSPWIVNSFRVRAQPLPQPGVLI